ncbi:YihY/virulence factor BrkB family protein [Tessaracoccus sp.]|uniref:YihY/virulence factor BrkB family protein n=1 Tax=Tessaracoccus sp. TaxID=1971211 RepID=UPI002639C4FE|nr:YihY/virulence factor BrkB family protein [Tessaracoccus sp.]
MPDSPTQLTRRSWKHILKRTLREFVADECTDAAAGLTYYAILALFPALIATFSLVGLVGRREEVANEILRLIEEIAPGDTATALREPIAQLAQAPGAGLALVGGILVALWSASGYVAAFTRVMNRIYEVPEGRPFWKLRPMQLLVTLLSVAALAVTVLTLVLSGPVVQVLGDAIGAGSVALTTWSYLKWPLLVFVVMLLVAVLYYATPNVKQPAFRWVSPGALLAIVALAVASLGFGLYVALFSSYDRTYGSLAGVVVFLLWVWIGNLALLFGAEFDAEIERGRELQEGRPAEKDIQLPPRDTRVAEKDRRAKQELISEARDIRRDADRDG